MRCIKPTIGLELSTSAAVGNEQSWPTKLIAARPHYHDGLCPLIPPIPASTVTLGPVMVENNSPDSAPLGLALDIRHYGESGAGIADQPSPPVVMMADPAST